MTVAPRLPTSLPHFQASLVVWFNSTRMYGKFFSEDLPLKHGIFSSAGSYLDTLSLQLWGISDGLVNLWVWHKVEQRPKGTQEKLAHRWPAAQLAGPMKSGRMALPKLPRQDASSSQWEHGRRGWVGGGIWSLWSQNYIYADAYNQIKRKTYLEREIK